MRPDNSADSEFGDILFLRTSATLYNIVLLSEALELTLLAYDNQRAILTQKPDDFTEISHPIGLHPDGSIIADNKNYKNSELAQKYSQLMGSFLLEKLITNLVSEIELLFNDVLITIILEYPQKLPKDRKVVARVAFELDIKDIQKYIVEAFVNELSYQGPKEYSESFSRLTGIDLASCASFKNYIELKATRDLLTHNDGIVNDVYLTKSGDYARAAVGERIVVDAVYFWQRFEDCMQIIGHILRSTNKKWPSELFANSPWAQSRQLGHELRIYP